MPDDLPDGAIEQVNAAAPVSEQVKRLSYEAPQDRIQRDPPPSAVGATIVLIFGLFGSAIVVLAMSVIVSLGINGIGLDYYFPPRPPPPRTANRVAGLIHFLGGVAALCMLVAFLRQRHSRTTYGGWFFIGLLIGLGIACLLLGVSWVSLWWCAR